MPQLQEELLIINKLGLHARAASKFVTTASAFTSQVRIGHDSKMVDGKSIMSVMMLAASKGTNLNLEVQGDDAQAAILAIKELVANRFDEDE